MSTLSLVIDAPVGYVNDRILVLNYRMRPERWEVGEILEVSFRPGQTFKRRDGSTYEWGSRWTYRVWIERERIEGRYGKISDGGYALEVGPDKVRPA
jgi:hypothetical protein